MGADVFTVFCSAGTQRPLFDIRAFLARKIADGLVFLQSDVFSFHILFCCWSLWLLCWKFSYDKLRPLSVVFIFWRFGTRSVISALDKVEALGGKRWGRAKGERIPPKSLFSCILLCYAIFCLRMIVIYYWRSVKCDFASGLRLKILGCFLCIKVFSKMFSAVLRKKKKDSATGSLDAFLSEKNWIVVWRLGIGD